MRKITLLAILVLGIWSCEKEPLTTCYTTYESEIAIIEGTEVQIITPVTICQYD